MKAMTRSVFLVSSLAIISGGLLFSQQSIKATKVIDKVQVSILIPEPKLMLEEKEDQIAMLDTAVEPVLLPTSLDLDTLQQKVLQDKKYVPVRKISQKKKPKKVSVSSKARVSYLPESLESELLEEDVSQESDDKVLNLSLNLAVIEHQYALHNQGYQQFHAAFEKEEVVSNIEMEAHFEGPHVENKERDVAPDGIGFGIKIAL